MNIERLENDGSQPALRGRVPCKINLFLEVLGKRPDGYHDLDTVMLAVDWCDTLTLRRRAGEEIGLRVAWPAEDYGGAWDIPLDDRNLVVRALRLLRRELGVSQGVDITLEKRIPAQAGLGGGSSDAAGALVLGSLLWTERLHWPLVCALARQLGSDINFFLEGWRDGQWTARCTGRGEHVVPAANPGLQHVVIAQPPQGCDTAGVFRALAAGVDSDPDVPRNSDDLLRELACGHNEGVAGLLYNRMEMAAAHINPWIGRTARRFDRYKPLGHCMSGSGSARFCLCSSHLEAEKIARELASLNEFRVFMASTWRSPSIQDQAKRLGFAD